MTQKEYQQAERYISPIRLRKYKDICSQDMKKTLKVYQANLRISQAFYPILSLFEVVLRNALNESLSNHFNDNNWLNTRRNRLMQTYTKNGIQKTNDYLLKEVVKTENKIKQDIKKREGIVVPSIDNDKILSSLSFGFWTALFDKNQHKALSGIPLTVFKKLPPQSSREKIYDKLTRIRDFRNRLYHNESIIFDITTNNSTLFSLQKAENVIEDIKDFFYYFGLDYHKWTKKVNDLSYELDRTRCAVGNYPSHIYYTKRVAIELRYYKNRYF